MRSMYGRGARVRSERSPRAGDGRSGRRAHGSRVLAPMEPIHSDSRSRPIALGPGEGEALWFLGALATIKASAETTGGRVAVIEHLAPRGSGSPLHVHHREDEWFYVLEGELTFWVGGEVIVAPAGLVRLRAAGRPAHVRRQLRAGALPARHRAGRLRGVHARARRAGRSGSRSRRPPTEPPDVEAPDAARRRATGSRSSALPASRAEPQKRRAGSAATGRPSSSSRNRLRSSPPA